MTSSMLREFVSTGLVWFDLGVLTYFLALNTLYLSFTILAYFQLRRYLRRWTAYELDAVIRSPATPGISLIVPAYNEEATISESVRSLLLLNYPAFEVVVVVDGAKDRTMEVIRETFDMLVAPASYAQPVRTQPVQAFYRSIAHPELVAIDKANGGKADAINAGINAARYPLVCVLDADSLLEEHALSRVVLPFIEHPDTVAAGGVIRIANGCKVSAGRVLGVGLPRAALARFQVVEYLRAFLAGRTALSALDALLIISGAFGLFRRDAVVEVGGFRTDTVGEDMEIVVRLHRMFRERRQPCRIVFRPDAVCWTEAPESRTILESQRNRWQRGTLQVMEYHRTLLFNPRYGSVGLFGMPFYFLFETIGPIVEFVGLTVTLLAVAFGLLDWRFAWLLFLAAVAYGAVNSVGALLLEEVSYRRYERLADLLTLCVFACVENLGYRQLTTWWRVKGTLDYFRKKHTWGTMTRKGFAST